MLRGRCLIGKKNMSQVMREGGGEYAREADVEMYAELKETKKKGRKLRE